jgi:segregation and condensation protein B
VAVDHVIRMLMEMQLIKIVGRSELPGRPMLYGTTTLFLEHFGLKDVKELPGITELARMEAMRKKQDVANEVDPEALIQNASDQPNPADPADEDENADEEDEDEEDAEDDDDEDDEEDSK